ncbi:MAG: V-type ATP synthase subunit A [bacterium]
MTEGKITKVSGPLVVAKDVTAARMYDVVRVGNKKLIGEIIELRGNLASIQVYEDTSGIGVGEPVISTGAPLSVELGPGLVGSIYDGIQRPLDLIRRKMGDFVTRGVEVQPLSREAKWKFKAVAKEGQEVAPGDILGTIDETSVITHKILVPKGIKGKIKKIKSGDFRIEDEVVTVNDGSRDIPVTMIQKSPIRTKRPYKEKLSPTAPLVTGQRIIDTLFPIAKGGVACIPGPFGSGKTVVQHQLAKWADAEIIVYIGCGERGNEMTDVLIEMQKLKDSRSGELLIKRTILIANTSNMPVSAREASVYTGITIAEYFRDMGYTVAVMADSTSRWAEALREMSGRLEEMPGNEGYPAYLGSRIAEFYERAGRVICLGSDGREGSITVVGAVSPAGGDLSEPVTQNTLRVVKVFWGLDSQLAYKRHFPAINWLQSYSLYSKVLDDFFRKNVAADFPQLRQKAFHLLQREAELEEIIRIVGIDVLSPKERLILEAAKSIREDFLHQVAFDERESYTSLIKQYKILKLALKFHDLAERAIERGVDFGNIFNLTVRGNIARAKYIPEDQLEKIDSISEHLEHQLSKLEGENNAQGI